MILLAIFLPPLSVLLCGKPFQALLNIPLTLCAWVPGVLHAILVLQTKKADERTSEVVNAIHQRN